jgi:hypothetical protein
MQTPHRTRCSSLQLQQHLAAEKLAAALAVATSTTSSAVIKAGVGILADARCYRAMQTTCSCRCPPFGDALSTTVCAL